MKNTIMEHEFNINVVRKTVNNEDVWTVWVDDIQFVANSEEDLREKVRLHLLDIVSKQTNKPSDAFHVRLKRSWRVRITDIAAAAAAAAAATDKMADSEDEDGLSGWDLFD